MGGSYQDRNGREGRKKEGNLSLLDHSSQNPTCKSTNEYSSIENNFYQ